MPSFSAIVHKKRKKGNENSKIGWKVLQLPYTACSYNFKNMSMCSYNFNVAVRISINHKISLAQIIIGFNYES